jgi:hypothetical protein
MTTRFPPLHPNVYVGASSTERKLAFEYAEKLRAAGGRITYAWWENVAKVFPTLPENEKSSDAELSLDEARSFTDRNVFGISEAWRVWLLFSEAPTVSRGLCAEAGICIGMGRKFVVSGPWQDFMFASHAEKHFAEHDEALAYFVGEIDPVRREERVVEEMEASLSRLHKDSIQADGIRADLDDAIRAKVPDFQDMIALATGIPRRRSL